MREYTLDDLVALEAKMTRTRRHANKGLLFGILTGISAIGVGYHSQDAIAKYLGFGTLALTGVYSVFNWIHARALDRLRERIVASWQEMYCDRYV